MMLNLNEIRMKVIACQQMIMGGLDREMEGMEKGWCRIYEIKELIKILGNINMQILAF